MTKINKRFPGVDIWLNKLNITYPVKIPVIGFWGGHPKNRNVLDNSCLSNHFMRPFEMDGVKYNCGEQAMMHQKALVFNDVESAELIMRATKANEQKQLGRRVRDFHDQTWLRYRLNIMFRLTRAKFEDPELRKYLVGLADGPALLVEASPYDSIWGVRLPEEALEIKDPAKWCGDNLLGFILTQVRNEIMAEMNK